MILKGMTRRGAFPFLNKQQSCGAGRLLSLPASPAPFAAIQPLSKLVPMDTHHTFLINRPSVQQGDRKNPSVSSQLKSALQRACTNLRTGAWFPPGKVPPASWPLPAPAPAGPELRLKCLKWGLCMVPHGELCQHSWSKVFGLGQWDRASFPLAGGCLRSEDPLSPQQESRRVQPEVD